MFDKAMELISLVEDVRDALAWYANQVIVRGDNLVGGGKYDEALAIYRSVPPRSEIVEIQTAALESQKKDRGLLEKRVKAEEGMSLEKRTLFRKRKDAGGADH